MGDMESIDRRLDALEAENRALRSKIVELETHGARKKIPEPAPLERGVQIYNPPATSGFVMPNDEQLKRLAKIVIAKVPWLGNLDSPAFYGTPEQREEDWMKQFRASFKALAVFKRTEQPNHKVYLSWHISAVEAYLRTVRNFETLRGGPFLAAVLSHGDIHYCSLEKTPAVGLHEHMGREATDKWKRVIETGRLLPASAPANRISEQVSPVKFYGAGY